MAATLKLANLLPDSGALAAVELKKKTLLDWVKDGKPVGERRMTINDIKESKVMFDDLSYGTDSNGKRRYWMHTCGDFCSVPRTCGMKDAETFISSNNLLGLGDAAAPSWRSLGSDGGAGRDAHIQAVLPRVDDERQLG